MLLSQKSSFSLSLCNFFECLMQIKFSSRYIYREKIESGPHFSCITATLNSEKVQNTTPNYAFHFTEL